MINTKLFRSLYTFFKSNVSICIILAAGLLARSLFYLSIDGPIMTSDTPTYIDGAKSLYYHLWLNEYRPPVYPFGILLVGAFSGWDNINSKLILLQVFLSLVSVVLLHKLLLEALGNKAIANIAAFLTAVSFRVFSWDFVILSENFAILFLTMITLYTVRYIKYRKSRDFKLLIVSLLLGIFTKPFFLLLPLAILIIFIIRQLIMKDFGFKIMVRKAAIGFAIIYSSVLIYSFINYAENVYFGITTVGNVNYFGKILQYKMEDLGDNQKLVKDIKRALETEKPEFIVRGEYLEPWHFVGTYGWARDHYKEVGRFSKEIILKHPLQFTKKSIILLLDLFIMKSPFTDYIAEAELKKAGKTNALFRILSSFTDSLDLFYFVQFLCLIEVLIFAFIRQSNTLENTFFKGVIMLIIIYHYVISTFFSYGDYSRLLAPSYPLIYSVIAIYLYRFFSFVYANSLLQAKLRLNKNK